MFESFTPESKYAISLAVQKTRSGHHAKIGSEHVLAALVTAEGPVTDALATQNVWAAQVREQVAECERRKLRPVKGYPPFAEGGKKVIELSMAEAIRALSNRVGTEHMLMAVFREGGAGAWILAGLGADRDHTAAALRPLLGEAYFAHGNPHETLEKLTAAAKQAVVFAQQTARRLGHTRISHLDVLIGVLYVPESLGPQALASLGVSLSALRQDAIAAATREQEPSVSSPPIPTQILAQALDASADVAHEYIGTEHLLLAAARAPVDVLVRYGVSSHRLAEAVGRWRGRVTEPAPSKPAPSKNALIPPDFSSDHEPGDVRNLRA